MSSSCFFCSSSGATSIKIPKSYIYKSLLSSRIETLYFPIWFTKLSLKSENSKFSRYKDHLGQLEEKNKTLNLRVDELEDQKWKLNKIVGKYQQEVKQ